MVEQLEVCTLTGKNPWEDFPDPGNVRPHVDETLTSIQQKDMEALWTGAQAVYSSQIVIRTALIKTLTDSILEGYKNTA